MRAPTRWSLQEVTRDHLVVASLCIGGGLHPAPARLTQRGYAWDPHHTGITPATATTEGPAALVFPRQPEGEKAAAKAEDKEQLFDAKGFASAARDSLLDVRGVAGPPARGEGL